MAVAQLLLGAGAARDAPNANGATPLFAAAQGGHAEAAKLLLEAGADKNAANKVRVPQLPASALSCKLTAQLL